jgi:uncharacterized protein with HEPN domain
MPPRVWTLRVQDMLDAIKKIQRYTAGHSFESFCAEEMMVDAVLRNIELIGEAANHIPSEVRDRHAAIPWDDIRGMRNVVAHIYFGVSLPIVWQTVEHDLPALLPLLKPLLEETDD